eukprot:3428437-Amphidinium_carterae.1
MANSRVPLDRRGGKLLERLKGDAFAKAELLDPLELKNDQGVDILLKYLKEKYEPLEAIKIGQLIDEFVEKFRRFPTEEIRDYDNRFETKVRELEERIGPMNASMKAHYFLRKLCVSGDKESQVITGASNVFKYEALRDSAIACMPRASSMAYRGDKTGTGSSGVGGTGPNQATGGTYQARGKPRFQQTQRKPYGAHEVGTPSADDCDGEAEATGMDNPESLMEEEGSESCEVPEELEAAWEANSVMMTQAKRNRSELEQARQFYRKQEDKSKQGQGESKQDRMKRLKARLPCARCGALGHWKDDPECPQYPGKGAVFVCRETGKCTDLVLIDTACAKTVAGAQWLADVQRTFQQKFGYALEEVKEKEPFRFGLADRIFSTRAVLVPMEWRVHRNTYGFLLRVSVVDGNVPCLISRRALKAVGAVLDMEHSRARFQQVTGCKHDIPLVDLPSGHCALSFMNYDERKGPQVPTACRAMCIEGCEVAIYGKREGVRPDSTASGAYACSYFDVERNGQETLVQAESVRTTDVEHDSSQAQVFRVSRPRAAALFASPVHGKEKRHVSFEGSLPELGAGEHIRESAAVKGRESEVDPEHGVTCDLHLAPPEVGTHRSGVVVEDRIRPGRDREDARGGAAKRVATHASGTSSVSVRDSPMAVTVAPRLSAHEEGRTADMAPGTGNSNTQDSRGARERYDTRRNDGDHGSMGHARGTCQHEGWPGMETRHGARTSRGISDVRSVESRAAAMGESLAGSLPADESARNGGFHSGKRHCSSGCDSTTGAISHGALGKAGNVHPYGDGRAVSYTHLRAHETEADR